MTEEVWTREFSICLFPNDDLVDDVQTFRAKLPPSPYRDDAPHITLLRGISSQGVVGDDKLTANLEEVLGLSSRLPLTATVQTVTNGSNQFYSSSGGMILRPSDELMSFRQEAISTLIRSGYKIEAQELSAFTPHITIRLGVPLDGDTLGEAKAVFENRTVNFGRWLLFRLVLLDGKRLMHEVWPT